MKKKKKEKNEVTARKEYLGYSKISNTIKSKSKSHNRISGDTRASATWQLSLLEWSDNEAMLEDPEWTTYSGCAPSPRTSPLTQIRIRETSAVSYNGTWVKEF